MLLIVTTKELQDPIMEVVLSDPILKEQVYVFNKETQSVPSHGLALEVTEKGINNPLDWSMQFPPYLLDNELEFTRQNLIASLYFRLGYFKACIEMKDVDIEINKGARILRRLITKTKLSQKTIAFLFETNEKVRGSDYCFYHNLAIVYHYGVISDNLDVEKVKGYYQNAISYALNDENKAFSIYHYARFLYDNNEIEKAHDVLSTIDFKSLSNKGKVIIKNALKATK